MGNKRCCKGSKGKKIYCKCNGGENKRSIFEIKKISRDVFFDSDIKKKIHKSKKHYDRKTQSKPITD